MGFFSLHKNTLGGLDTPLEVVNWRLFFVAVIASGGGLIFGYDLAFVSGTFALPAFQRRFQLNALSSQKLQTNCLATFQGGAFFGVIILYWFNEKYGRRVALIVAGLVFNVGVILQITPRQSIPAFYVGRILSGFGVGASTYITPQYISEVSPAKYRGALVGFFEVALQVGSMTGFWINYGVNEHVSAAGDKQWHITIAMQFVPVTVMIIGLLIACESPRWLYMKNQRTASSKALTWVRNLPASHPYIVRELADYERQYEHEEDITTGSGFLIIAREAFSPQLRFRLFLGCALQIFLNSTGVNALNYFLTQFVQALGYRGTSVKLLSGGVYSIIKGVTNSFTMLFLLDRFGRRPLNLIGSVGIAFTMYYMAAFTSITDSFHSTREPNAASKSALAMFYLYGASYSLGWGLVFIVNSEIYPNRVRGFCMAWATCFHWIGEFYTSFAVAYMLRNITYGTFLYFGTCTVLGGVFFQMFVPETNGKSLEDMDVLFEAKGLAWQQMRTWDEWKLEQMTVQGRSRSEEEGLEKDFEVDAEEVGSKV